nr:MAG TPA: hypothetical protein [Caudoviricetes sp.]
MTDFAKKGVANTGLALAATALGLQVVGGAIPALGGGAPQAQAIISEKDAEIAELKAREYSNNQDATLYKATREENKQLRDELFAYITPIAQESAKNREEVAVLKTTIAKNEEINDYEVEEVDLDVVCEMEKIYRTLNHIMTIKKVLHP